MLQATLMMRAWAPRSGPGLGASGILAKQSTHLAQKAYVEDSSRSEFLPAGPVEVHARVFLSRADSLCHHGPNA